MDLTPHILEEKLIDAVSKYHKAERQLANAEAEYEKVKDQKDIFFASLCDGEGSQASQDKRALAHPDYKTFLAGLADARRDYLQWKHEAKALSVKIEGLRSLLSMAKFKMELHGGSNVIQKQRGKS